MRISDWSSDVCSSDLAHRGEGEALHLPLGVQPQDLLRVRLDHHLVQATVKRGIDADPVPVPIRRVHPEPIGALQPGEIKLPERRAVTSNEQPLGKLHHAFLSIMPRLTDWLTSRVLRRAGTFLFQRHMPQSLLLAMSHSKATLSPMTGGSTGTRP